METKEQKAREVPQLFRYGAPSDRASPRLSFSIRRPQLADATRNVKNASAVVGCRCCRITLSR
jgi:hypothetical protein